MPTFEHSAVFAQSPEALWDYYDSGGAFQRVMPEWDNLDPDRVGSLRDGERTEFTMSIGPLRRKWVAVHHDVEPGVCFSDLMETGPMAHWDHHHRFERTASGGTKVTDRVDWRLPLHPITVLSAPITVTRRLERMFRFRTIRTQRDMDRIAEHSDAGHLRVLVSGSSGLVGTQLCAFLRTAGHEVVTVHRSTSGETKSESGGSGGQYRRVLWNDRTGEIISGTLDGFDAVVHLAGAGIGDKRWSSQRKADLRDSRVVPTRNLVRALAGCEHPPEVFLCASAIGWYGDRGESGVDEYSDPGTGFLAELCTHWEAEADEAATAGMRVVKVRSGIVTTSSGGALSRLLPPAKFGLGGPIGRGRQYQSWISLDDEVHAIHHLLLTRGAEGAFNLTAPTPVPQREFARVLGRVLRRPAVMPLPPAALELAFGEMGRSLIIEGQRVLPTRLGESGFRFSHETLEECLRDSLGRW